MRDKLQKAGRLSVSGEGACDGETAWGEAANPDRVGQAIAIKVDSMEPGVMNALIDLH